MGGVAAVAFSRPWTRASRRLSRKRHHRMPSSARPPNAAPTPMPALAPVESPPPSSPLSAAPVGAGDPVYGTARPPVIVALKDIVLHPDAGVAGGGAMVSSVRLTFDVAVTAVLEGSLLLVLVLCPPTVVGSRASRGRSGPALVKRPPTWLVVHLQASPIVFKGWTDSWQPCHISSCLDLSLETMQRTMPTRCCSPSVYLRGHAASFSYVSPLVQPAQ